ncbi:MAG: hypothetical protein E7H57_02860 [Pantoea sp.]|nr:hypothetical protein [Pantoea sp.]
MIKGLSIATHSSPVQEKNNSINVTRSCTANISNISNTPSAPVIAYPKNKKTRPLDGLRKWFTSQISVKKNSHRIIATDNGTEGAALINKADGNYITQHADKLIEQVAVHGDALVLSFGRGLHSAILLNDNNTIKYFSFFSHEKNEYHGEEDCYKQLKKDMKRYNDTLFTGVTTKEHTFDLPLSHKNNFQKIKIDDVNKAINAWRINISEFKILANNCSSPAAAMIRKGTVQALKFKHQRRMQMPYNTFNMARELARIQQKNINQNK